MKYTGAVLAVLLLAIASFAQNTFQGHNIILGAVSDHRGPTCTVRYASPDTVITITDIDRSTPMKLTSCDGKVIPVSNGTAVIRADPSNFKWCFRGEDNRYKISFSGITSYLWTAEHDVKTKGFWNIREFGAAGDGKTDDTIAFKSAMAILASNNGGTLTVPDGDYVVSSPIALPSGITIQGTNGLNSGASTSDLARPNPTRITLEGSNKALFQIGECVENVTIRDIELNSRSNQGTSGIEAFGAYTSSQGFNFDRVTFQNFNRGINVYGFSQTNLNWQFDYVKLNTCRFVYNRDAGIFTNLRNSDWKIQGSLFLNPKKEPGQNGDSMHFERVGMVTVEDTFGGGFQHAPGGTFIDILDSGNLTIIGSQTESMTNSIVYNAVNNPQAGDYSYPITIVNSIFGAPIVFRARRTFVSVGSSYGGNTFQADERLRVYSTGDRFCYDGYTLGCQGATEKAFDHATVVFMTGQPSDGKVLGRPTFFGTDVRFGAGVQLPSALISDLPPGRPNGTLIYCSNCRRNSTPCTGSGSGAPAMTVNGEWSCL